MRRLGSESEGHWGGRVRSCAFECLDLVGCLGARERLLQGLDDLLSEKEEEWRLVLGGHN